jgi:hypothetical protein
MSEGIATYSLCFCIAAARALEAFVVSLVYYTTSFILGRTLNIR